MFVLLIIGLSFLIWGSGEGGVTEVRFTIMRNGYIGPSTNFRNSNVAFKRWPPDQTENRPLLIDAGGDRGGGAN